MAKTVTITLYEFDELSAKAKEKARDWWRECEAQTFGAHGDLYEPYETAARLLGIEFKQHGVPLMNGKTRNEPAIYWELHVQGSGASFAGTYYYAKGAARAIRAEFSADTPLLGIAQGLQDLQKKHGYALTATITQNGSYTHKYTMSLEGYDASGNECDTATSEALLGLMREFADYIYKGIQDEYDYRMSDENVDDAITANEYTFRADGERSDG